MVPKKKKKKRCTYRCYRYARGVILYSGILTAILLFANLFMVVSRAILRLCSNDRSGGLWLYRVPAHRSFSQKTKNERLACYMAKTTRKCLLAAKSNKIVKEYTRIRQWLQKEMLEKRRRLRVPEKQVLEKRFGKSWKPSKRRVFQVATTRACKVKCRVRYCCKNRWLRQEIEKKIERIAWGAWDTQTT